VLGAISAQILCCASLRVCPLANLGRPHWLDPALAVPEIARVLRDGGRLGVIWTHWDRRVDWAAGLARRLTPRQGAPVMPRRGRTTAHACPYAVSELPEPRWAGHPGTARAPGRAHHEGGRNRAVLAATSPGRETIASFRAVLARRLGLVSTRWWRRR
jgi:SAM-dependent methyltransferase